MIERSSQTSMITVKRIEVANYFIVLPGDKEIPDGCANDVLVELCQENADKNIAMSKPEGVLFNVYVEQNYSTHNDML